MFNTYRLRKRTFEATPFGWFGSNIRDASLNNIGAQSAHKLRAYFKPINQLFAYFVVLPSNMKIDRHILHVVGVHIQTEICICETKLDFRQGAFVIC
jgi:hypothetical protein